MQTMMRRTPGVVARLVLMGVIGAAIAGLLSVLVLPIAVFATETVETPPAEDAVEEQPAEAVEEG